jgi:cysteine-rich repeat protein
MFLKGLLKTTVLTLAVLGFVTASADDASAHDGTDFAISSEKIKMQWDQVVKKKGKFQYKTKNQIQINDLSTDPSTVVTSLSVRGTGAGDGDTGVIVLDPSGWKATGTKGWKYKGDTKSATSGGVHQVKIQTHPKGGRLQIKAKGQYWDYALFQPQTTVEISLNIGTQIFCAQYGANEGEFTRNEGTPASGKLQGKTSVAIAGGECPSVCGNGQLELGEECDDGNNDDGDTCNNSCAGCDALEVEYDATFEAIQALIFDSPVYDCSNDSCHGSTLSGDLDLREGASFSQLVSVPTPNWAGNPLRVFPGDQDPSLLYSKLAHATLGAPTIPSTGTAMPSGGNPALAPEHLEAIRLWIRGGAPETGVVAGTSELLGACLPSAAPNKIPQPDPPAAGTGVQFAQPGYDLLSQSERELCVSSYYDVEASVPAQFKVPCPAFLQNPAVNPGGDCFAWNYNFLAQDPQSHHSIIHIYTGDFGTTDPGWGDWTCYGGDNDGADCDPLNAAACPNGGVCGGADQESLACLGYGPSDYGNAGNNAPTFGGSQESTSTNDYPAGVYGLLPVKGIIVWNSHAFNLTNFDMQMEAWLNMEFTDTLTYLAEALFDTKNIFLQNVEPFQTKEYCDTHTFSGTETINLFELSSHTHRHGKRWRYYQAPQTPCASYVGCTPGNPADMFYESFEYSDALQIIPPTPWIYPHTGDPKDRTIKYCSLYDNGATDPTEVKRRSTSPCPPIGSCVNGGGPPFGGPCNDSNVKCVGGLNKGFLCGGDDLNCPSSVCDACNVTGGVTTEDEMFIPLGTFFRTP